MERSPKRRRVSLTRSVSISPIKIATDTVPIATLVSPLRPSYMSPTRSSLARTNPELLPSPRISLGLDGADDDVYDMMNIGKEKRLTPRRLNPTPLRNTTPNRGSTTPPIRLTQGGGIGGDTGSRRSTRVSGKRVSFAGGGTIGQDVSVEQENLPAGEVNTQTTNGASPDATDIAPDEDQMTTEAGLTSFADGDGESGLPKMPSPEIAFGPPGMLSSSPSGQAARRLTVRRSMLPPASRRESTLASPEIESSPQAAAVTAEAVELRDDARDGDHALQGDDEEEGRTPPMPVNDDTEMVDASDEDESEELDIALLPSGPIVIRDLISDAKQDELEILLREKRRLEGEVGILQKAWLRHQEQGGDQPDMRLVLDIVTAGYRATFAEGPKESLSHRLGRLLPFGITKSQVMTSKMVPSKDETAKPQLGHDLLEISSPLQVKSTQNAVLFEEKHIQRHILDVSSTDGLLNIGLDVEIDPITGRIFQIGCHGDWSDWSKPELLEFCKGHLGGEYGPSTCDVNAIGKAASCYWDMASLRARTWRACIDDHRDLVVDIPDVEDSEKTDVSSNSKIIKRLHLGRRSLRLEKAGVCLSINWSINFEWTGEARSDVSASAAFPTSWRERDDAKSLEYVNELFYLFLRRFGMRHAVRTLVELMFGTND